MNRETLFSLVSSEGIPLTKDKLRRYVQYGWIVTYRKWMGRAKGAAPATYHERSVETLREITSLSGVKQEHVIFILYWRGYPVDWQKLKDALIGYLNIMLTTITTTATLTLDPANLEYAAEELAKDALPKLRPGKPSKEDKALQDEHLATETMFIRNNISIIQELSNQNSISVEAIMNFVGSFVPLTNEVKSILTSAAEWANPNKLLPLVQQAIEEDFIEMYELIKYLREHLLVLEEEFNLSQLSMVITFVDKLNRHSPQSVKEGRVHIICYIMIVLLPLMQHTHFRELLSSESAKGVFQSIGAYLQQLSDNVKGGEAL